MKRFLVLLLLPSTLYAQRPSFCIGGVQFTTSELARRVGIACTVKATFAVREGKPFNMTFTPQDSCSDLLVPATQQNLGRVIFLHDAAVATIYFHYAHVCRGSINTDYAAVQSDSSLLLVFRRSESYGTRDPVVHTIISASDTTIVLTAFVWGTLKTPEKPRIVVERRFFPGRDTTIVIENNHPELTDAIIQEAKGYELWRFLPRQPGERSALIQPADTVGKRFLLNFDVIRLVSECGWEEVY